MERIGWIDFLRGAAMILILVFHTEAYYKEYDVTPYYVYTTNAIILFYFISGFLFFFNKGFNLKKRIKSIVNGLLIPYFVFTSLIVFPKTFVRHDSFNWQESMLQILSGRASWFIAALIVAEMLFSVMLLISRGKHRWLSTAAVGCLITYYLIPFNQHNYWQWQDALLAVVFLYSGYMFHQYKEFFNTINKPLYTSLLFILLIIIKVYEYQVDWPMRNIAIENVPLFLADSIVWLLLVVSIIKYIPHVRMIEWTGQHCIIYYFLCGGCPFIISTLLNNIGLTYDGYFYRFLMAFMLSYALATVFTKAIYKLHFLLRRRVNAGT